MNFYNSQTHTHTHVRIQGREIDVLLLLLSFCIYICESFFLFMSMSTVCCNNTLTLSVSAVLINMYPINLSTNTFSNQFHFLFNRFIELEFVCTIFNTRVMQKLLITFISMIEKNAFVSMHPVRAGLRCTLYNNYNNNFKRIRSICCVNIYTALTSNARSEMKMWPAIVNISYEFR